MLYLLIQVIFEAGPILNLMCQHRQYWTYCWKLDGQDILTINLPQQEKLRNGLGWTDGQTWMLHDGNHCSLNTQHYKRNSLIARIIKHGFQPKLLFWYQVFGTQKQYQVEPTTGHQRVVTFADQGPRLWRIDGNVHSSSEWSQHGGVALGQAGSYPCQPLSMPSMQFLLGKWVGVFVLWPRIQFPDQDRVSKIA